MGDRDGDGSRAANVLAPGAPRTPGGPPQQTGATPGSSEGVPIDGRQMQEARVSPIQTSAGAGEAIPACPPPLPRNTCIRQGVGTWSTTPPAPPARVLGAQSCSPPPELPPSLPPSISHWGLPHTFPEGPEAAGLQLSLAAPVLWRPRTQALSPHLSCRTPAGQLHLLAAQRTPPDSLSRGLPRPRARPLPAPQFSFRHLRPRPLLGVHSPPAPAAPNQCLPCVNDMSSKFISSPLKLWNIPETFNHCKA